MRKYWAILAIFIIASSNLNIFAKGKARFSVGKQTAKKKKKKRISLNVSFCELVNGSIDFLVCASGEAGEERLTREELYSIKQSSVLLSQKIERSKAKKVSFERQRNKKTRKASRIIKANPKYCSVLKGTPNITVCAQGIPGKASITNTSLSSVQEAALTVQKKYNKANKKDFIKFVIDNMSVQSCEYIYGEGNYRCAEDYDGTSCDEDPSSEACANFCEENPDHEDCTGTNYDSCSYDSCSYDSCSYDSCSYDSCSYDSCSYDSCSYDSCSYDSCSYDSCSYDSCSYDSCSYDSCSYDSCSYDSYTYDSYTYDSY